jgi:hypothetical protein
MNIQGPGSVQSLQQVVRPEALQKASAEASKTNKSSEEASKAYQKQEAAKVSISPQAAAAVQVPKEQKVGTEGGETKAGTLQGTQATGNSQKAAAPNAMPEQANQGQQGSPKIGETGSQVKDFYKGQVTGK